MDFTFVKCENCDLDMSYGEYILFIAQNDITYSDILGDYVASTEGQSTGSLDEWD